MDCLPAASCQKLSQNSPRSPWRASPKPRRRRAAGARRSAAWRSSSCPRPSLHDGRFANDGWLQELPDPLTKLTWDNPALVSPKTAETLGLASEDLIRVDYSGRSLELPVSILPGMADGVVALTRRLWPFARGSDRLGGRVRRVHGPKLQSPWLRQRGQTHQARAHVSALGDPEPRQHGGAPHRPRVDPHRASIGIGLPPAVSRAAHEARMRGTPHAPRKRERFPPSASSRRNRITSHSGRSMPTIRATSGG